MAPRGKNLKSAHNSMSMKEVVIKFVKGFKRPTKKDQIAALGMPDKKSLKIPAYFDLKNYEKISNCTSENDWLASVPEKGQTYDQFIVENPWLSVRRPRGFSSQSFVPKAKSIQSKFPQSYTYILPFGFNRSACNPDHLLDYASRFFSGNNMRLLSNVTLKDNGKAALSTVDAGNFNASLHCRRSHGHIQLRIFDLLNWLVKYKPNNALCLIALTSYDLYDDDPDLFVAGMAQGNRHVAVFSLYRYHPRVTFSPEHWHEISTKPSCNKNDDDKILLLRTCRLLVHELCHLYGIAHCIYFKCCMNGSGHLDEDFSQPISLCPIDLRKLQQLIGFDILDRYQQLHEFYTQHEMTEEVQRILKMMSPGTA